MITLSLSKLEQARVNPLFIASEMAKEKLSKGGNVGFVSTFKTAARYYLENDLRSQDAVKELDNKLWMAFKETPQNNNRRKLFCESFLSYAQLFSNLDISISKFQVNLDWEIITNMKLTGHSPFLCSNENYKAAYYFSEKSVNWRAELKYALLQIYLAEKVFKCDVKYVKVGIYDISNRKFDLHTYEDFELDNAIEECKRVFNNVLSEYNRILNK
jgi:hypothetical protein